MRWLWLIVPAAVLLLLWIVVHRLDGVCLDEVKFDYCEHRRMK